MKSSSELFPVSLVRAELVADTFIEDTYLIKPNNSPDKSVQVAITRLGYYESKDKGQGVPVILLHGSFTNRSFWFSSKGKGLARALLESGLDPWMLEMRGHGDSPVNANYTKNSIEEYAEFDLPAALSFVKEQTNQPPIWIGHSMGGVTIATAFAGGHLKEEDSSGLVLLGAQVSRYPILLRTPFANLFSRLMLSLKKPIIKSKVGPEHEPLGVAQEFVRWSGLLHGWKSTKKNKYWNGFVNFKLPLLAFGAKKDRGDPSKYCKKLALRINSDADFYDLGIDNGFSQDYNHVNMVISENAKNEVWPKIIEWINFLKK